MGDTLSEAGVPDGVDLSMLLDKPLFNAVFQGGRSEDDGEAQVTTSIEVTFNEDGTATHEKNENTYVPFGYNADTATSESGSYAFGALTDDGQEVIIHVLEQGSHESVGVHSSLGCRAPSPRSTHTHYEREFTCVIRGDIENRMLRAAEF